MFKRYSNPVVKPCLGGNAWWHMESAAEVFCVSRLGIAYYGHSLMPRAGILLFASSEPRTDYSDVPSFYVRVGLVS